MEIYTIGFTKRTAESFFEALRTHQIRRVVDVRLNNVSQLAGFTKRDDLRYFLDRLLGVEYRHEPTLTPTPELLGGYRRRAISWADYEAAFRALLEERSVAGRLDPEMFSIRAALLCSERTADRCHRRLVAEYLAGSWGDVKVVHL